MTPAMLTLGVDLASQDRNTAACTICWRNRRAKVQRLESGVGNETTLELMDEANVTGMDAPFGWPARFLTAITAWTAEGRWTASWDAETVRLLRLRETDRWIHSQTGKWPLSVSADSIAVGAMRAAVLLGSATADGQELDRLNGPCFEVYPGAALVAWNLARASARYKKDKDARAQLLTALAPTDGWLALTVEQRDACIESDHVLDAVLWAGCPCGCHWADVSPSRGARRARGRPRRLDPPSVNNP